MAGRITVVGAQQLLTAFFSKTAEAPDTLYMALIMNSAPTPYLSGEELDEPVGMGYQRAPIPNDSFNWANGSQPFVVSNLLDIPFATATADWGQVKYWAITSSLAGGVNYITGDFANPLYVNNGDQVLIAEGTVNISIGPFFTVTDN